MSCEKVATCSDVVRAVGSRWVMTRAVSDFPLFVCVICGRISYARETACPIFGPLSCVELEASVLAQGRRTA